MKKTIIFCGLISSLFGYAQESDSTEVKKIIFSGSYEGNGQWYGNDKERGIDRDSVPLRSNNYLFLNLSYGRFSINTQIESYENRALLNYNPRFDKTNFGTYALNYKSEKLDVTLGHFYEQFGSGLALRSWEDRALGINNAIRGGRIAYSPVTGVTLTGLYGNKRTGFEVSAGDILGFNGEFNLSNLFNIEGANIAYGGSYVGRKEALPEGITNINPNTFVISNRISVDKDNFYANIEHDYKSEDGVLGNDGKVNYNFIKPGSALLINLGYSANGFGIDMNLRRLENMFFTTERNPIIYSPEQTSINFNDNLMNFIPSLTKQHHSNLANIYVYQAQGKVSMQFDERVEKFGEIGGQVDVFYEFKKRSALGGRYGTKVSFNISNWANLKANNFSYYNAEGKFSPTYDTKFLDRGQTYFAEYSFEIAKKLSENVKGLFTLIHQNYNDKYIRGIFQTSKINSTIAFAESTFLFGGGKALNLGIEHMWADSDRKNWLGGNFEYSHNENWSIFATDMWNYGFDPKEHLINSIDLFPIHFYNAGIAFKRNSSRIALNYGRQRGGLVCAGGVCRFVPPSTGLGLQINTTF